LKKKIIFVTGTRADFGKIKSVIYNLKKNKKFKIFIVVTGMHMLKKNGLTIHEVKKNFNNLKILSFKNQYENKFNYQDIILSNTINNLRKIFLKLRPDLIITHGDRVETLATVISGSFNNFLVAHIEGGEVSGTIDEHIRHAVSKLSHLHFVSNDTARNRLIRLGENKKTIFITGSPDVDLMLGKDLPSLKKVLLRYKINFKKFSILLLHPDSLFKKNLYKKQLDSIFEFIEKSNDNFILIYPNNDPGNEKIIQKIIKLKNKKNIKIFPSMRFEYFLVLLKNASCMIGNSSSGIRETPYYGIPTINIGERQRNRSASKNVFNIKKLKNYREINNIYKKIKDKKYKKQKIFGLGNSGKKIKKILLNKRIWSYELQKYFND